MASEPADDHADRRRRMVREQLARRDITDPAVLAAFERVPRHRFVPDDRIAEAYHDWPLPVGWGATISQPYIVALMTQALEVHDGDRVLEVGTGSGYQAAILAELGAHVTTVEHVAELAERARHALSGYGDRVTVITGDGTLGVPEDAPFDAICVTAAAPSVPAPLLEQLADAGRLVIPVASRTAEDLVVITRRRDRFDRTVITKVRFVPLVGEHGY